MRHRHGLIDYCDIPSSYMFKSADKAALQEIGPRFTLKLRYLKKGTPAVHQLGAAPPPLLFDREDSDEEVADQNEDEDATPRATNPGGVRMKEDEKSAADDSGLPTPQTPATSTWTKPPPKDEEYIWLWKVRFQTYFPDTRCILTSRKISQNWRNLAKHSFFEESRLIIFTFTVVKQSNK